MSCAGWWWDTDAHAHRANTKSIPWFNSQTIGPLLFIHQLNKWASFVCPHFTVVVPVCVLGSGAGHSELIRPGPRLLSGIMSGINEQQSLFQRPRLKILHTHVCKVDTHNHITNKSSLKTLTAPSSGAILVFLRRKLHCDACAVTEWLLLFISANLPIRAWQQMSHNAILKGPLNTWY